MTKKAILLVLALLGSLLLAGSHDGEVLQPSIKGYTIRMAGFETSGGIDPQANNLYKTIVSAPDGRYVEGVDVSIAPKDKENAHLRYVYYPEPKGVVSYIDDALGAIQTDNQPDHTVQGRVADPANHCLYWPNDEFTGYQNLQGYRFAYIVLKTRSRNSPNQLYSKDETWIWEEAHCMPVQNIRTYYDASGSVKQAIGMMLLGIDNGKPDVSLLNIPATYRDGSMKDFEKEQLKARYGDSFLTNENVLECVRERLSSPDPHEQTKAVRPHN